MLARSRSFLAALGCVAGCTPPPTEAIRVVDEDLAIAASPWLVAGERRAEAAFSCERRDAGAERLCVVLSGGWSDACTGPMPDLHLTLAAGDARVDAQVLQNLCFEPFAAPPVPAFGEVTVAGLVDGLPPPGTACKVDLRYGEDRYRAEFRIPE